MTWLSALLGFLAGCNPLAISQLRVGESTRTDVLKLMGKPESIRQEESGPLTGADVLDYSGQPEGTQNWQVVIGKDDIVRDVRELLGADNFARVFPGMHIEDVYRLLGKPARIATYALSENRHYEWRYQQSAGEVMLFAVVVSPTQRVVSAQSVRDNAQDTRGG